MTLPDSVLDHLEGLAADAARQVREDATNLEYAAERLEQATARVAHSWARLSDFAGVLIEHGRTLPLIPPRGGAMAGDAWTTADHNEFPRR